MPGRKTLRRLQYGFETTNGTTVAATTRWRGPVTTLDDKRTREFVEEDVGIIGNTDRNVMPYGEGNLKINATPLTPEQFQMLLATGLGGPITGSADGSGSTGFRYVTTIPTTTAPAANRSVTVETGDDFEQENAGYTKNIEWTVKGVQKKAITVEGSMMTQPVARLGTGFSSTTLATLNDLLFWNAKLFLDAVSGTMGTTAVALQFLGFEINCKSKYVFKQTGEGASAASTPTYNLVVYASHEITVKLTLENDTAVDGSTGLKALFRAGTPRLVQIDCMGQTYGTPGTGTLFTGGRRGVRFALPVLFTEVPPLDEIEGNDIITVSGVSRYNTTFASAGSITVCNELAAL